MGGTLRKMDTKNFQRGMGGTLSKMNTKNFQRGTGSEWVVHSVR
jgi:hypothetical protein